MSECVRWSVDTGANGYAHTSQPNSHRRVPSAACLPFSSLSNAHLPPSIDASLQGKESKSPEPKPQTKKGSQSTQSTLIRNELAITLSCVKGPIRKKVFRCCSKTLTIGSAKSATIAIECDQSLSGQHAIIQYSDGYWWLGDVGGAGGTYLRVGHDEDNPFPMDIGDQFLVGDTTLTMLAKGEPKLSTPGGGCCVTM